MKKNNAVPLLDLAPRLKRPLRLWNPFDYLRLLYWVFFFPQAIGWYVREFGKPEYRDFDGKREVKKILHNDPVLRRLFYQSIIVLFVTTVGTARGLSSLGVPLDWFVTAVGVAVGVALGVVGNMTFGVAGGVALGVAAGVVGGLAGGAAAGMVGGVAYSKTFGVAIAVTGGLAVGIAAGAAGGVGFGAAVIALMGVGGGVLGAMGFGAIYFLPICILVLRLLDYIFQVLLTVLFWCWTPPHPSRLVYFPLPGIQKKFEKWLKQDWDSGVHNANQMLAYTLQFKPVVKAINKVLGQSTADTQLSRVSALATRPFDWKLLKLGSADFSNQFLDELIRLIFQSRDLKPEAFQTIHNIEPRLDTPARAACAGFWYWHEKKTARAVEAFAVVREMRHGPELFGIADSVSKGLRTKSLQDIADWSASVEWLESLPHPELRPGTLEALRTFRSLSGETAAALNSQEPLKKNPATSRIVGTLTQLAETDEPSCLQPEWSLIKAMAITWRNIFRKKGAVARKKAGLN